MPREGDGYRCVPMMDGSDHSRHALARRGSEMGEQGPQGLLEFCPIQLDTVQLNWTWFYTSREGAAGCVRAIVAAVEAFCGILTPKRW